MKRVSVAVLVVCGLASIVPWSNAADDVTITTFNVPGAGKGKGQGTLGEGIANNGTIVGTYIDSAGVSHGFLRSSTGTYTKFDVPKSASTSPTGINAALSVTGSYTDTTGAVRGFVRTSAGKFTTFAVAGAEGTLPTSINSTGEIAGSFAVTNYHGFLRSASGTITNFNEPQETKGTRVTGLNDGGAICGYYLYGSGTTHTQGFLRAADGTFTKIDVSGSADTYVTGVNLNNDVAGSYSTNGTLYHGFLLSSGTYTSFDPSGSLSTFPTAVNSAGVIAGYFANATKNPGFLRNPNGNILVFDVAEDAGGTWPTAINPKGAVTGYYIDSNGVNHGFLRP
ncbi:MAG TPA: hypothetical protein VF753_13835 [Terriglobales bacterium]